MVAYVRTRKMQRHPVRECPASAGEGPPAPKASGSPAWPPRRPRLLSVSEPAAATTPLRRHPAGGRCSSWRSGVHVARVGEKGGGGLLGPGLAMLEVGWTCHMIGSPVLGARTTAPGQARQVRVEPFRDRLWRIKGRKHLRISLSLFCAPLPPSRPPVWRPPGLRPRRAHG